MSTSVPLSDEVLGALVQRCLLAEDPVPGAVLDQALAAFEGVRAATRHASSSTDAYPELPGLRAPGEGQGFL